LVSFDLKSEAIEVFLIVTVFLEQPSPTRHAHHFPKQMHLPTQMTEDQTLDSLSSTGSNFDVFMRDILLDRSLKLLQ